MFVRISRHIFLYSFQILVISLLLCAVVGTASAEKLRIQGLSPTVAINQTVDLSVSLQSTQQAPRSVTLIINKEIKKENSSRQYIQVKKKTSRSGSFVWNPSSTGSYTLKFTARVDKNNLTTSTSVVVKRIKKKNEPIPTPTVAIPVSTSTPTSIPTITSTPIATMTPRHEQTFSVVAGPLPLSNPLKGHVANLGSSDTDQYPPSRLRFSYFKMSDLMPGQTTFSFTKIDQFLDWCRRNNKHGYIRIYMDYPNAPAPLGTPQWLIDLGIRLFPYTTVYNRPMTGTSPDYTDTRVRSAITSMIQALGARYDGHPDLAWVQVGFIGHWGEWHIDTNGVGQTFPNVTVQREVMNAFKDNFHTTQYAVRYSFTPDLSANPNIGFHDDCFMMQTTSNPVNLMGGIINAGLGERWKTAQLGGEYCGNQTRPFLSQNAWTERRTEDLDSVSQTRFDHYKWTIQNMHLSSMRPWFESNYTLTNEESLNLAESARMLGYSFRINQLKVDGALRAGSTVNLSLSLSNVGVAPFYYRWPLFIGFVKDGALISSTLIESADIRTWQPGSAQENFSVSLPTNPGTYQIVFGIKSPQNNRMDITFANANHVTIDGNTWVSAGSLNVL